MKSRISLCNKTVFGKNVLRFAPLWGLYLAGGLLRILSFTEHMEARSVAIYLSNNVGYMSVVNLIYGALCALLLFGELFDARRCRMLHATPVRRETWFLSHVLAGMCFSLIPNLMFMLTVMPQLGEYWQSGLVWLLAVELEFLFFFGLAVFCVMLAGNRFAAVAIYGILNFGALLIQWFVPTLYEPLLPGVEFNLDVLTVFCPVMYLCGRTTVLYSDNWLSSTLKQKTYGWPIGPVFEGMEESWVYPVILAVLGIVLGVAALLLYRRRNLERAGDALAVKKLEPVFAVIFSLFVGSTLATLGARYTNYLVLLAIGLLAGWIVAQMLIQRTVRIFRLRSFVGFVLLAAILGSTFAITKADPLNVSGWLPDAEQVASVTVEEGYRGYGRGNGAVTLTEPEYIQEAIEVHHLIIHEYGEAKNLSYSQMVKFTYCMRDGRIVTRAYRIAKGLEVFLLKHIFSEPKRILQYTDWEEFLQEDHGTHITGLDISERVTKEDAVGLLEAIKADCEAGNMAQAPAYHLYNEKYVVITDMRYGAPYQGISIYPDAKNTMAWIEAYLQNK